jgi:hypothetical protein
MSLGIEERVARFARRAADLAHRVADATMDPDLAHREADLLLEIGRGLVPEVKAAGPALEARLRDALILVNQARTGRPKGR